MPRELVSLTGLLKGGHVRPPYIWEKMSGCLCNWHCRLVSRWKRVHQQRMAFIGWIFISSLWKPLSNGVPEERTGIFPKIPTPGGDG